MVTTIDLHFQGIPEAIACYLLESKDGYILVETGPHSTYPVLKNKLNELGISIEDIRHVLLTHIHLDHAGAAWAIAEHGATIYVHPFGEKHLSDPSKLLQSAKRIYQDQMDRLWGTLKPIPKERIKVLIHEQVLNLGGLEFIAWHTPGHAIHHIAYQLEDQVFTGDVGGVKIGQNGLVVPPCPPPDIHIEQWQQSIALLSKLAPQSLFLTHFGQVEAVDQHLQSLEDILLDWANWMRTKFEKGNQMEEITSAFEKYVAQFYKEKGMTTAQIGKYNLANPLWMSVGGLMRYWKKKLS